MQGFSVDELIAIGTFVMSIIGALVAFIVNRFTRGMSEMKSDLKEFRKDIVTELRGINDNLHTIDRDLREKINGVDRRVLQIETAHKRRTTNGECE